MSATSTSTEMTDPPEPGLVRKFFYNLQTEGVVETLRITRRYLLQQMDRLYYEDVRERLPIAGYAEYGSVAVPPELAPKRRLGERSLLSWWSPEEPTYKGYLQFLRTYVSLGDDVTIIGGGRGVSSVVSARQVGSDGTVTAFEGSPEMFRLVDRVTVLNGVRERCLLRPVVVGPAIDVYTDDETIPRISPTELDPCNLLLLDCEGAEYDILPAMEIRPRYIVVELHPDKIEYPADAVLNALSEYELVETAMYDGESVSEERFHDLLERRKRGEPDIDDSSVENPVAVLEFED